MRKNAKYSLVAYNKMSDSERFSLKLLIGLRYEHYLEKNSSHLSKKLVMNELSISQHIIQRTYEIRRHLKEIHNRSKGLK